MKISNKNKRNIISFEAKLTAFKNTLLERVTEFKNEFVCDNADKISELKFNSETLHTKAVQNSYDLKNELRDEIVKTIDALKNNVTELSEQLSGSTLKIEGASKEVVDYIKNDFCMHTDSTIDGLKTHVNDFATEMSGCVTDVVNGFNRLDKAVKDLSTETTGALSSTVAKILENIVSLKSVYVLTPEVSSLTSFPSFDIFIF